MIAPASLNSSLTFLQKQGHAVTAKIACVCVWHTYTSSSVHDLLMRWFWLSPVLNTQSLSFSLAAQGARFRLEIFSLPESRRCNAEVSITFFPHTLLGKYLIIPHQPFSFCSVNINTQHKPGVDSGCWVTYPLVVYRKGFSIPLRHTLYTQVVKA